MKLFQQFKTTNGNGFEKKFYNVFYIQLDNKWELRLTVSTGKKTMNRVMDYFYYFKQNQNMNLNS